MAEVDASSSAPPPPGSPEQEDDIGLDSVKNVMPASVLPDGIVTTMKRKKLRPTFTVDDLMSAQGIEWLRDNMPKLAKFDRKDDAADTRRLIRLYRGWCSKLFSGLSFEEMVSRIEKFGSKARVRNAMEKFRTDQFWDGKRRKEDQPRDEEEQEEEADEPAKTITTSVAEMIAAKREAALAIRRRKRQLAAAASAAGEKENNEEVEEQPNKKRASLCQPETSG